MRTLQYLITAAIATAIAFSSCKKEAESPQEPDQEANFSRETGAPIIFGASSASATSLAFLDETRTYFAVALASMFFLLQA